MRSMFDLLVEMGEERGKQEGRREGKQEGMQEGMQSLLVGLLETRFGALPAEAEARLDAADPATLQRWSRRLFAAGSLAEVFAE